MVEKRKLFEKRFLIHILLFVAAVALVVYFVPGKAHRTLSYEVGKPWTGPALYATAQMAVPMDPETEKAKKDSIDKAFIPFFRYNASAEEDAIAKIEALDLTVPSYITDAIRQVYQAGIVESDVYDSIQRNKLPTVRIMVDETDAVSKSTAGMYSVKTAYQRVTSKDFGNVYSTVINFADYIRPNFIQDEALNAKYLENEYRRACTRAPIEKGELIIARGEKVSAQKALIIQAYEKLESEAGKGVEAEYRVVGFATIIVGLFFLLYVYFSYNRRESILTDKRKLLFVLLVVTGITIVSYTFMLRFAGGIYFMPITLVPVILVTFFDTRTAFFASVVQVMLCSLVVGAGDQLSFIFLHLTACVVAINTLQEMTKRSQLVRTGIFILIDYAIVYTALRIIADGNLNSVDYHVYAYFLGNTVLLSLAYVVIFVFEKLFGFTSKVTLVELADVNSPLLQELSAKCPGTFQHSVQLSNLVSDAAREIGANSQLARAGALYHDIGKMNNPAFFTENQHDVNPHDLLTPEQSAKIVINHVIDGVKRAEKEKLPAVIKDFILEHHGKSLTKYFYTTACNNNGGNPVDPAPFTYPGPNPRSKETSLLMMADATEAASRSLNEYSDQTITNLVNRIIGGQIAQGLMCDSPLSFRDVETVKKVFISRLKTMYHTRIAYPELKKPAEQPRP